MKRKRFFRQYGITMLVGLVLGVGVFAARQGFSLSAWPEIAAALCDACFVPSALLVSIGLLLFVSNDGLFYMMSYGVQRAARLILSARKQSEFPKSYYEYWELKQAAGKATFGYIIAAGLTLLALATVFLFASGTV